MADAIEAGMSGRTKLGFFNGDALRNGAKLVEESSIAQFGVKLEAKGFGVSVADADSL